MRDGPDVRLHGDEQGVDVEEHPERAVEPVCALQREQGGRVRRRQCPGLPRRDARLQESDQDAGDHRERRRDPAQRVEPHRGARGLPPGAEETRLSGDPTEAPPVAESDDCEQRVRDLMEHLGALSRGPASAVGDGRREHAAEPRPLEAQDDLHGKCCRLEELDLGEVGARDRGRGQVQ